MLGRGLRFLQNHGEVVAGMGPRTVKVLFFASARELAGVSSMDITLEEEKGESGEEVGCTAKNLVAVLTRTYKYLDFEKSQISLAINKEYVTDDMVLRDGDEVALLPPIAGG